MTNFEVGQKVWHKTQMHVNGYIARLTTQPGHRPPITLALVQQEHTGGKQWLIPTTELKPMKHA